MPFVEKPSRLEKDLAEAACAALADLGMYQDQQSRVM